MPTDYGNKKFLAEYSKSDRASCKLCKLKISKEVLRLAVLVQSRHFDGKVPNWYHEKCFWAKMRPTSVGDIANVTNLRWEDQELIKQKISSSGESPVAPAKKGRGSKKSKAKAEAAPSTSGSVNVANDFSVEYAKSNRAMCHGCDAKIAKGDVRVSRKDYDSEEGMMHGGLDRWHHLDCFKEIRHDYSYYLCGSKLPGFKSLKKEDQTLVQDALPPISVKNEVKQEIGDEADGPSSAKKPRLALNEISEQELKKQNEKMYLIEDILKDFSKKEMVNILESNKIEVPSGIQAIKKLIADYVVFGKPKPCSKCNEVGKFEFIEGVGYKCKGIIKGYEEYAPNGILNCDTIYPEPAREKFKIPSKIKKKHELFQSTPCEVGKRIIVKLEPTCSSQSSSSSSQQLKSGMKSSPDDDDETRPAKVKRFLPLKNILFNVFNTSGDTKNKLERKIINLGGEVCSKLKDEVIVAITSKDLGDSFFESSKADSLARYDVYVVKSDFLDMCAEEDSFKTSDEVAAKIESLHMAPYKCITSCKDQINQFETKRTESYKSKSAVKSKSGTVKLEIKDGNAVDPDSGLASSTQVYKSQGLTYSVTLSKTDLENNKNSYYKLQILKSISNDKKYYLFRAWGRTGTVIGGTKVDSFKNSYEAITQFDFYYEKETGNSFYEPFVPIPGKMVRLDVKYDDGEKKIKSEKIEPTECSLDPKVTELVQMLFDEVSMKSTLKEFELDLEKMPLGKLSKEHIKGAYAILNRTLALIPSEDILSDIKKKIIVNLTNTFYTLVPHSFGLDTPPLLDNEELVKSKLLMLESMMQIEIAYSIKQEGDEGKHPIESCYEKLGAKIQPVTEDDPNYELIYKYVANSHAETHRQYELKILEIFDVVRNGEVKRFKPFEKIGNKRLLWHGSRLTNFASIISKGLCIAPPEAPVTGYMFGKGIYFADSVSKSANYCMTNSTNNVGILLLCEVALGKMLKKKSAEYITGLPQGWHSVKGQGKSAPRKKDAITIGDNLLVPLGKIQAKERDDIDTYSLLYNEFIVYDPAQVKIRYLLKVQFDYAF